MLLAHPHPHPHRRHRRAEMAAAVAAGLTVAGAATRYGVVGGGNG